MRCKRYLGLSGAALHAELVGQHGDELAIGGLSLLLALFSVIIPRSLPPDGIFAKNRRFVTARRIPSRILPRPERRKRAFIWF